MIEEAAMTLVPLQIFGAQWFCCIFLDVSFSKAEPSMSRDFLTLDELVLQTGRDRRQIEKLVNRGIIPGRRVGGDWRFHETEITHWLEQDLRGLDDQGLAQLEQSQQSGDQKSQSPIAGLLHPETCEIPLDAGTRPAVLQALIEVAGRTWQVWDPAAILKAVKEREDVMSTGFENGIAIPHPRNPLPDAVGQSVIAFGKTLSGITFGAPGRQLTDLFFLVLARDASTHLQILARLGRLLQREGFIENLRQMESGLAAYELIVRTDEQIGT
jgi:PTS system nitrogen regulatory IIA component